MFPVRLNRWEGAGVRNWNAEPQLITIRAVETKHHFMAAIVVDTIYFQ
jgi:hypothetical protein